jgi:hypothetical protein
MAKDRAKLMRLASAFVPTAVVSFTIKTEKTRMVGYSGTPLAKKLGIKSGTKVFVRDAPVAYEQLLNPMPEGVNVQSAIDSSTDVVHLFSRSKAELADELARSLRHLRLDAALWISWPKKASKVSTDITEDVVRELAFPLGLVDIKVCAIDEVWSGLKLVIRKEHRPKNSTRTKKPAATKKPPHTKKPTRAKASAPTEYIHYHKDGTMWAKGPMLAGVATGYWEWFRKDGTIMRSGHFKNGEQVGEWTTYASTGRIVKVTNMKSKAKRK